MGCTRGCRNFTRIIVAVLLYQTPRKNRGVMLSKNIKIVHIILMLDDDMHYFNGSTNLKEDSFDKHIHKRC